MSSNCSGQLSQSILVARKEGADVAITTQSQSFVGKECCSSRKYFHRPSGSFGGLLRVMRRDEVTHVLH